MLEHMSHSCMILCLASPLYLFTLYSPLLMLISPTSRITVA